MNNNFLKYELSYEELFTDPDKTAPLLGYDNGALPDDIYDLVKEVIDETKLCFDICGGYRIFDDIIFIEDGYRVKIDAIEFNLNKRVFYQLKHSQTIAIFVCTAGEKITKWAKQMMACNEPLKSFIADIIGSITVESAIDIIQKKLADEMMQKGLKITNRYSPGYCGWLTEEQHKLFALLPKNCCGIELSESALMKPIKSVSGFIGIGSNVRFNQYTCKNCEMTFCVYRKKQISKISKKF